MTDYKSVTWSGNALSGANPDVTYPLEGANFAVVGLPTRLVWQNVSNGGSLYFFESGTNLKIATLTTGSNTTEVSYPATKWEDNAGTAAAAGDNLWRPFLVSNPVYLTGSGFTSGTNNKIGQIRLEYVR